MKLAMIPGMQGPALPIAIVGYLVVRNRARRRNAGRISGHSTPSRESTPEGQDGESFGPPRRPKSNRRLIIRR